MKIHELKIGDSIRIVGLPAGTMHADTKKTYLKLISRGRSVRICSVDDYGQPWFHFRFQKKNRTWESHWMCVMESDNNWVVVKPRTNRASKEEA